MGERVPELPELEISISPEEIRSALMLAAPPELTEELKKIAQELFRRLPSLCGILIVTRDGSMPLLAEFKEPLTEEQVLLLGANLSAYLATCELQLRDAGLGFLTYSVVRTSSHFVVAGFIDENTVFAMFLERVKAPGAVLREIFWLRQRAREVLRRFASQMMQVPQ